MSEIKRTRKKKKKRLLRPTLGRRKKKALLKYFKLGEKLKGCSRIVKQIKGHDKEKNMLSNRLQD